MLNTSAAGYRRVSLWLLFVGGVALILSDPAITTRTPGREFTAMLTGVVRPDFLATENLWRALFNTVAFAFQGVALGAVLGFVLAALWHRRSARAASAVLRAVHELFWGLVLLQITGLSPATAVLAIALPYAGIFGKVFGEFLEEADRRPAEAVSGASPLSLFFYTRLPLVWGQMKAYLAYRFECGLRSAAILGFIGLPTLGFHLETALRQGQYDAGAALLYLFIGLILTMRWWLRPRLVPIWLLAALMLAPPVAHMPEGALIRFAGDLIPAPLRVGEGLSGLGAWFGSLMREQGLPGLWHTLVLGTAAMVLTGILALMLFPMVSRRFSPGPVRAGGHLLLVTLRSLPEFLLAFVFLIAVGPTMLAGILALALHTGAIIAHLLGRFSDLIPLRDDAVAGVERYFYEVLPRLYSNFLAFLFYRWETIMRETAILGLIGIPTLGFYIDSAFSEFRFDRALVLIALAVILNLFIDALSRAMRRGLRLDTGDRLP